MPLSTQKKIFFVIMAAAVAFLAQENNLQRSTVVETDELVPFPPEMVKWEQMGKYINVFGHRMFAVHSIPSVPVKDVVLIVHGFPSSIYDFAEILPLLTNSGYEVVLVDMLGFGLSDKPIAYSYSLHEQADSMLNAWYQLLTKEKLETHRLHILSHDMGDSVTAEILTRLDKNVAPSWLGKNLKSVTINNGGIYAQLANLRISQILLRNKYLHPIFTRGFGDLPWVFRLQIKSILGKKARDILSSSNSGDATEKQRLEKEIELMWWSTRHKSGYRRLPQTIGYIDERYKYQVNSDRWNLAAILNRLQKSQGLKVHVVWGMDDSVAPKVMAHKLIEDLNALQCQHEDVLFPDLGHWSMIEDPLKYASSIIALLKKVD
eukprot:TRINITY_DN7127_c0_g1_i1.p1 TRINITY_DN7127_c0_g1~~TRINITY_DN7127_c0_g1_i1.p1  ORF type:complete len:376 (+),score=84.93 TRINITY_DN7127_c0_g1_i1:103-1230(+)